MGLFTFLLIDIVQKFTVKNYKIKVQMVEKKSVAPKHIQYSSNSTFLMQLYARYFLEHFVCV